MAAWNPEANAIFLKAVEIPLSDDRQTYLDEVCGGDAQLRVQVEALIIAGEQAGSFLESPPSGVTAAADSSDLSEQPGSVIGPYKLLEQIGEGGMGVVYMAEQQAPVRRRVALKIIKPGMDTRRVIARFEAERQALAMMDHPNIAKVLEAGTTDGGRPYFVMELVKGIPITEYCDEKHLSLQERLELMVPVCQAVQHAHQKGVIHRDIKPTNVLVAEYDDRPVPKVIDFGVAKAMASNLTEKTLFTEFGQVVGTVEYMSPEQAKLNQLDIDTRSDIYSLGVLLYELLTGSTPLERKRLNATAFDEMLRIIREEEPPKPSTRLSTSEHLASLAAKRASDPRKLSGAVKGELDWVVMKCLAKDRDARYASANDLAADIRSWLQGDPLSVRAPGLGSLLRVWLRHNFGSSGWAVALGVTLGIVAGALAWLIMLNPLDLSVGSRRVIYLLGVAFMGSGGLITVWLVRPKNTAADLAGGAITGVVAAVISFTLSWGSVAVSIAGVPYGIWLGMTSALVFVGSICTIETLAAGMLVRRHGDVRSAIGPYAELVVPSILTVVFSSSVVFRLATVGLGEREWHLLMVPPLLVAVSSVLWGWPWGIRALIHVTWVLGLCALTFMWGGS